MKILPRLRASVFALLSLACAVSLPAQSAVSQPANRIAAGADMSVTTRLTGHLPRWVSPQADAGAVPDQTQITLSFLLTRSPERELAFTQLLVDQQNPSSPRYHQWLTPEQIGEQYGPSTDDVAAVTRWIAAEGMQVTSVAPSRLFINVTGTAAVVGAALSTSFHHFTLDGELRLSATSEPAIPAALAVAIGAINGLTDVPLRPFHTMQAAQPRDVGDGLHAMYSDSKNTTHYIFPGDFAKIYDVNAITGAGFTGTGVKVAIIGRSQITATDITELEGLAGLPSKTQNTIVVPGTTDPGLVAKEEDESTLDVSRVLTIATGAQADLVIASSATGGIGAGIQYNIQTLLDPIMTISYGNCETAVGSTNVSYYDTLFKQGAAEGISTFVSSGDSGAAGCATSFAGPTGSEALGMNFFCSSSYVTCVGGTEFNDTAAPANYWATTNSTTYTSALGYIPEGAWNEPYGTIPTASGGTTTGYEIAATGGGASLYIAKPSWQTGTTPTDSARDVPDISFTAANHDGYYACLAYVSGGDCNKGGGVIFAGTSAAAPDMAAVAAILNQKAGKSLGNLNPILYALSTSSPTAFHDATPATSGVTNCTVGTASMCNNSTPSSTSYSGGLAGFPLLTGYDQATGLGSLDVTNFITAASGPVILGSTTTLSASPSTLVRGGSAVFTATVAGGTSTAPTGTVQFYLNGAVLGSPVTLTSGGTASTAATAFPAAGTYTITATYSGDTTYSGSTAAALSFVVTLPATTTTVTVVPTTVVAGSSAVFTATVAITGSTAASGTVQFYSNGATLGPAVAVSGGKATTAPQQFTAAGTYAITATYSGDTNNAASTSASLSFVVTAMTATGLSVSASPTTITVSAGATTGNTTTIALATTASYYGSVLVTCSIANSTSTVYPPTCSLAPATVTFTGATAGSSVLTVTTTIPHAQPGGTQSRLFIPAGGLSLAGLLLLLPAKRRRRMGMLAVVPVLLLGASLMTMTGCGSSGATTTSTPTTPVGTTKGTYNVVVIATPATGTPATTTVTLTVQ